MQIKAERGYLIPAINDGNTDYVACAQQLADSIRQWHPAAEITILTVEDLPFGDCGGWANDWQCFYASPYRQTIKLEADMIAAGPIDHWWDMFAHRDMVISQGCRNIYNNPSESRFYRALFDQNRLPDVYNAITYWRLSKLSHAFFDHVRNVFENWDSVKGIMKFPDEHASTDVVYAIVAMILGVENVTLPRGLGPSIVHMKKNIIGTQTDDWTEELVWESTNPGLRIHTVAQHGIVHYHVKDWRMQ